MRRLLCWLGLHSRFVQYDRWGKARVCRYCERGVRPLAWADWYQDLT